MNIKISNGKKCFCSKKKIKSEDDLKMEIYIKADKKILIKEKNFVCLKDICEIVAPQNIYRKLCEKKILAIKNKNAAKKNYLISIADIIKAIKKDYENYHVINLGEQDIIIEYSGEKKSPNKILLLIKIIFVCLVLFMGSATAIMSFHSDAQIPNVFKNYYQIFFGREIEITNPKIITIPYSIGLSLGIIIFFNHIGGKKITSDPTPIEVEMSLYDQDMHDTLVDSIKNKNAKTKS